MSDALHLVSVWNPSYARTAMEEHLAVLLAAWRRYQAGEAGDEDVRVWWGKVRSPNRQQPQRNMELLVQVRERCYGEEQDEVQLYLTDYRSLYVADVDAMEAGELADSERERVPAYYEEQGLGCDFWFRLRDIRRLVADDLNLVIDELKKLRNVGYADRPVSLYGGMVDLPLVVKRPDAQRFFSDDEYATIAEDGADTLWAAFDAERGAGANAVALDLKRNVLGEAAWSALEATTRTFVATAEQTFRAHRDDPSFDFGPVMTAFAKALEVQANTVLRRAIGRLPERKRLAKLERDTVDLSTHPPLSLGQLARVLGGERELGEALKPMLEHTSWFTGQFPAIADAFREVRNEGAHAARVDRKTATQWRDLILGVGCEGHLVHLSKVRPR